MEKNKLEEKFVAIDVETTGLSPFYNELIEISAIKYENGKKIDSFTTFVKPKSAIPVQITAITGITNEMVSKAPFIEEVMPELVKFIDKLPIVAHNARFDYQFIQSYSKNSFTKNKVIDTVLLSKTMYKGLKDHKLGTVARHLGITEDGFHRAEFDCECCAKIYLEYLKLQEA